MKWSNWCPWIGAKLGPPVAPKRAARNGIPQGCENEEHVVVKYSKTLPTKMEGTGIKTKGGHAALDTRLSKKASQRKGKVAWPNRSPEAQRSR